MKKLLGKIPVIIGMLLTLYSFFCVVQSHVEDNSDIWILAVIVAALSLVFYTIDAIVSFVKAGKKNDSVFNTILGIVLIAAIPMLLFVGGGGPKINLFIWNGYYLAMFVLEIISMIKIVKSAR